MPDARCPMPDARCPMPDARWINAHPALPAKTHSIPYFMRGRTGTRTLDLLITRHVGFHRLSLFPFTSEEKDKVRDPDHPITVSSFEPFVSSVKPDMQSVSAPRCEYHIPNRTPRHAGRTRRVRRAPSGLYTFHADNLSTWLGSGLPFN